MTRHPDIEDDAAQMAWLAATYDPVATARRRTRIRAALGIAAAVVIWWVFV